MSKDLQEQHDRVFRAVSEENKGAAVALPDDDADRGAFERWVSAPPFEYSIERMTEKSAWPGSYRSIEVQLAWCAWREVHLDLRARLAEVREAFDLMKTAKELAVEGALAFKAERDAMRAQRDEAAAALSALRSVSFDRRKALDEFERLGDLYYLEFGCLRPGKDDPIGDSNSAENNKQYSEWAQARTEAAIDAADATLASLKGQA